LTSLSDTEKWTDEQTDLQWLRCAIAAPAIACKNPVHERKQYVNSIFNSAN